MSRSDDCIWKSLTKNWRGGRPNGFHRNRRPAGGTDYFLITCCRRTRELTSTFWLAKACRKFQGTRIDLRPPSRDRYVGISRGEKLLGRSKARRLAYVGLPSRLAPGRLFRGQVIFQAIEGRVRAGLKTGLPPSHHTVPYGTALSSGAVPGTSCQA